MANPNAFCWFALSFRAFQFTVSLNVVVCCSEPDVAVTVIVDVTGRVSPPPPDPAPPQPSLSRPRPATLTASSKSICKCRRILKQKQQIKAASATPGETVRWISGERRRWSKRY